MHENWAGTLIEDLTMRFAELSKIKTVEHSLIRLKSEGLAYITKRIDRLKKRKLQSKHNIHQ